MNNDELIVESTVSVCVCCALKGQLPFFKKYSINLDTHIDHLSL
jgi:hypothetical protein